jgi:hypothetical protein
MDKFSLPLIYEIKKNEKKRGILSTPIGVVVSEAHGGIAGTTTQGTVVSVC